MGRRLHVETTEPAFKPGSPEYEADVLKRARKAATAIGKTLEHYKLIGEALSIIKRRAMKAAGLEGSNKPPAGPRYTKALNEELDKAQEFLAPEVFESGSARVHCTWLHESAADVEWTFQVAERNAAGSTRRWNNPTYIWKQWRRLTAEPTKAAIDAKVKREAKAKAQAEELENYRNEWKVKYEAVKAELDALRFDANPPGEKLIPGGFYPAAPYSKPPSEKLAELIANDPFREVEIAKPKRTRKPKGVCASCFAKGVAWDAPKDDGSCFECGGPIKRKPKALAEAERKVEEYLNVVTQPTS